jgi:hypothetical protein
MAYHILILKSKGESMENLLLKIEYGVGYMVATAREYFWLQVLHLLAVLDKSGEARKQYNIARYKFHHL